MPYIGNQHNVGDHVNNFKVLDDISSHTATFDGSATSVVSVADDTIRVPLHRFIQGQRVTYTNGGGGNIGGLTTGTAYFVSFDSANTIKLATTLANANSNTVINLSAVGSGTSHTLNAAFDGVNTKFKMTHGSGKAARLNNATQINVAINNVIQRPNIDPNNFTDGFALEDNHKIVFKTAPTVNDIFWGSIIANTIDNFDLRDNEVDNFTGNASTTEFTLSTIPANNESVVVTIDGVLQHPSDKNTTRAYTLIDSIIQFTAAPALNAEIQVRHIGFAGASTNDVSGFYGRTGNVALTANDHITTGDITSRNINSSGIITATTFDGSFSSSVGGSNANFTGIVTAGVFKGGDIDGRNLNISGIATFAGNVSIGGTLTYEDVTNIDSVGIITARNGLKVLAGGANVVGVVTATSFVGGLPITNGADNRVITAASASSIQGESLLTFNGYGLGINDTSGNARLIVSGNSDNGDHDCQIRIYDTDTTAGSQIPSISFWGGSTNLSYIRATNTGLKFYASGDGTPTQKLIIKNDGHIEQDINASNVGFDQVALGDHYISNVANANRADANDHILIQRGLWNNKEVAAIKFRAGADTTNKDDGYITFETSSANNVTERLRIKSDGGILQTQTGGNANFTISRNESVGTTNQVLGVIDFASNTAHTVQARLMGKSLGTSNVGGDLVVETRADGGSLDERLRITGAGQMGLGMSPTRMFEVKDSTNANRIMNIRGTGTSGAFVAFLDANTTDDSKCRVGSIGGNSIGIRGDEHKFQNGAGTNRMVITSGGDVGVGNDSPNCRLAVKDVAEHTAYANVTPSVGDCMLQLYNNPPNETANDHATIQFGVNGGSHNRVNTISAVAESAGNRKLAFTFCTDEAGSRTEKLRITGDGRIEVGTGTGVFGSAPIEVKRTSSSGWGNYPEHISLVDQKAYNEADNGSGIVFSGKYNNGGSVTTFSSIHGKKATTGDGNFGGILTFNTREHGNSNFERMRIDSFGRVFINAVDGAFPSADYRSLNIVSHAHTEASISLARSSTTMGSGNSAGKTIRLLSDGSLGLFTHNSSEDIRISSNGNVKIGSGAPGAKFHVSDSNTTAYNSVATTAAASLYLVNSGTNGPLGIILQNASTDGSNTCQSTISSVAEGTTKSTALTFGTRQNSDASIRERVRITSQGCLAIGTTNPSQSSLPGIHIKSTANDDCRIAFETGNKPSSRIGYYGLSNRFGVDVYNGFEIRDVAASYASRFLIGSDGQATFDVGAPNSSNKVIGRFQSESTRALDIVWHDSGSLMGFNTPGNHSYIFKCNGGEKLRITSGGRIGVGNDSPDGRNASIDISSNDGTSGKTFTDQRSATMLTLRNPSTTQHSFTQMAFINGGGTQAATLLRHRYGSSHGSLQNYVGDLCLFRRTGGDGSGASDYRESTRWCGSNAEARQVWWAYGDSDTSNTSRLGWHHLSAQRDHPGTDAYSFFRLETGAASYARNGMGKYTVVWTTGHASGYGLQIGHFGYYMNHGNSRIYVNEHIIHRERYSNGSYYGWNDAPNMRIINSTASGGTNACIVFRCGGRRYSGFDMGVMVGIFIELYVPESANGDTCPRLYIAGNSESNLDGGGFGTPVNHAFTSFQSSNPNHSGQP